MVDTKISRAPDILVIHLKRFSYQSGYLEKIEDLVNFPINNLDVSPYLSAGFKKHQKTMPASSNGGLNTQSNTVVSRSSGNGMPLGAKSHLYDLYAVVNHIMYHNTGGGHYTSYVLSE